MNELENNVLNLIELIITTSKLAGSSIELYYRKINHQYILYTNENGFRRAILVFNINKDSVRVYTHLLKYYQELKQPNKKDKCYIIRSENGFNKIRQEIFQLLYQNQII